MKHADTRSIDKDEIMIDGECWRVFKPNPSYMVSDKGHVKSFLAKKEGLLLAPTMLNSGYLSTSVKVGPGRWCTMPIHRLVAATFIDNPEHLPEVNHKDGNKVNNCADNLEWCDAEYNIRHAMEHGLYGEPLRGTDKANTVINPALAEGIYIERYVHGTKLKDIAHMFGVTDALVRGVVYKYAWTYITDELDKKFDITPASRDSQELSKEDVRTIYLAYKRDHRKVSEIENALEYVSAKTIYRIIEKKTYTHITDKLDAEYLLSPPQHRGSLTEDIVKAVYLDLRKNNVSSSEVQRKYGVSAGTVSNLIYKYRWKEFTDKLDEEYNIPSYEMKQNRKLDAAVVEKCYRLLKSGYTTRQVSNMYSVSNDVLRMIWKKKSWKNFTDELDEIIAREMSSK